MAPQIMAERTGFRALWSLATVGLFVLLAPAAAAPDAAKPAAVVVAQADTAKPATADKDKAASKTREKSKAKPAAKDAAKTDAKVDSKTVPSLLEWSASSGCWRIISRCISDWWHLTPGTCWDSLIVSP